MDAARIMARLEASADPDDLKGMARYAIPTAKAMGVRIPVLRKLAKEIGLDHELAAELWALGWRETRILAGMIDDPTQVTEVQMEAWAAEFDGWEVCDQSVMNLFEKTPFAFRTAHAWSARDEEMVKRAGFVMMARLAVSDKAAGDGRFIAFLPAIIREATDGRNFVKKGVSWALRQIGKRNERLHGLAVETAREIEKIDDRTRPLAGQGRLEGADRPQDGGEDQGLERRRYPEQGRQPPVHRPSTSSIQT